jgi:hypothetical protein
MLSIPGHKENPNQNLTPVRIAIIKNTTTNKCCQGYRKKELSDTAGTTILENNMEAS